MEEFSFARNVVRWAGATLVAAAATGLLAWLGANATTAGMVFLVLVVCFAAREGIRLSLYTTLLCALFFDYFFLPPAHSMRIVGIQVWVAMASFLASCVVVGRVAEVARRQTLQAEQRREDVERLNLLSQEMMIQEDASVLTRNLPQIIGRIFALEGVVLYLRNLDQCYASTSELPMSIHASMSALARELHPTVVEVPGGFQAITLMEGMRPVGSWGWRPAVLSREVAAAVSAQVAIAFTRTAAIESSTRLGAVREGERLRTALVDSLTHELRTPLTSIRAAATTLRMEEELDADTRRDLAAVVDEESARLDMLIGEAVEMAEIDANAVKVCAAPEDARAFLEQAIEESRAVLAGHRVVIAIEETEGDSGKPVWFDPHLLGRVLRHLLENAARYTPAGGRITLRSCRTGGRLEFFVEDEGPGIDLHDLPLIFEKFYRGKKGIASRKGTGMGLAITRAILTAHGGGIEVENLSREGASFHFWVPLVEKEPPAA